MLQEKEKSDSLSYILLWEQTRQNHWLWFLLKYPFQKVYSDMFPESVRPDFH